jgi:hypothetical protein
MTAPERMTISHSLTLGVTYKKTPDNKEFFPETEYTRSDLIPAMVAETRNAVLREAAKVCTSVIKNYDVLKPDGMTYEPMKVQKAAKCMVSLARQDILALRKGEPT